MGNFKIPHAYKANRAPMGSAEQRCIDCGEEEAHAYHTTSEAIKATMVKELKQLSSEVAELRQELPEPQKSDWVGDSPFFLMFDPVGEVGNVGIDIDLPGWIEKNKAYMRSPGTWFLMAKRTSKPVFSVLLHEGDQFYYTKRHIGNLMAAKEILCYGIGKKSADGTTVNLWLLPNGMVCGGSDVDVLGARMI